MTGFIIILLIGCILVAFAYNHPSNIRNIHKSGERIVNGKIELIQPITIAAGSGKYAKIGYGVIFLFESHAGKIEKHTIYILKQKFTRMNIDSSNTIFYEGDNIFQESSKVHKKLETLCQKLKEKSVLSKNGEREAYEEIMMSKIFHQNLLISTYGPRILIRDHLKIGV